ncbi:hypothetical protein Metbo_0849 [Methanobacterium lacus]|uniref:Coenzyme PQQ synthesis protein D (PqqD) n=1 Tax=Methanobacterium lacus (strain AL-21) TaxID=877455 RepID=F0TBM2_METLA|nr:PqqD family protein [Methanobacterium lacus]ADZ09099.1 hypothetical protein Metbo_0849 [Methanobacterium lacus]
MNKIYDISSLVVADDVVSCNLDDEVAILNTQSGIYYGLDPIGAKIWNSLQKPCSISDLIELILEEYDVEEERFKTDLLDLVNDLKEKGLVKVNVSN